MRDKGSYANGATMMIRQRITIVTVRKPARPSLNEELQWLGSSLGLFGERDKDKSCFRLFIELVKASKLGVPMSSDDLARTLGLTRGTAVHHLNRLMETGLVVYDGRRYWLRQNDLELLIDEIRKDIERQLDDLRRAAREIDEWLSQ